MNLELSKRYKELAEAKKAIELELSSLKEEIEKSMTDTYYVDEVLSVTFRKSSESISIDSKKVEKKDPELYLALLKNYKKVTTRSACYAYELK